MDIELIKRMMDACYQGKRIRDMLPPLPDGVASSFIQYLDIIEKLEKQGIQVKVSDVSDALSLPRPGVTRTVKDMEAKGYVKKLASAEDGRITYLTVTEAGKALSEKYNKQYRTADVLFNCEMIPAENVGVKHAKWDREDGYAVPRDCYNSYFYVVEDQSLNVVDKFRLHGRRYIDHLTGGSALHMNLEEHLSKEQYRHLLRVAAAEGCNYFTFNIPNTVCNKCGHIDKRYLKACPACHSDDLDYLTRVIGYMKRVSNFSAARQQEAERRYYGNMKPAAGGAKTPGQQGAHPQEGPHPQREPFAQKESAGQKSSPAQEAV